MKFVGVLKTIAERFSIPKARISTKEEPFVLASKSLNQNLNEGSALDEIHWMHSTREQPAWRALQEDL